MRKITAKERKILDALGGVACQFAELKQAHPSDAEEFTRAIHAAQNIVLARPATEEIRGS